MILLPFSNEFTKTLLAIDEIDEQARLSFERCSNVMSVPSPTITLSSNNFYDTSLISFISAFSEMAPKVITTKLANLSLKLFTFFTKDETTDSGKLLSFCAVSSIDLKASAFNSLLVSALSIT